MKQHRNVTARQEALSERSLFAAVLTLKTVDECRAFFRDLPETACLFDLDRMIRDGQSFDYSTISPEMIDRSWVPSYCQAS